MESHYICQFRYRLVVCIKKFPKYALTLTTLKSPLGVSLSLSHTRTGFPQGFNLNFPTSIPVSSIWESPRPEQDSLRADEINLWLTPSAKQRQNPCSGLPAVYPDMSARHDWPVKKRPLFCFVVIANQVKGKFETHFR